MSLVPASRSVRPGWEVVVSVFGTTADYDDVDLRDRVHLTSSDPAVARVELTDDGSGRLLAVAPGRVTLTARSGAVSAIADVEVRADAAFTYSRLSAGERHTCTAGHAGPPVCWGANASGQLGNGTDSSSPVPVPVAGLRSASVVSVGMDFSCALSFGHAYCWGNNESRQLGDATDARRLAPDLSRPIAAYGDPWFFGSLSAGARYACGVQSPDPMVACWGGTTGMLPRGEATGTIRTVSAGGSHLCGLSGATVKCWGSNDFGQLGDGTTAVRNGEVDVAGLTAMQVSAGLRHTCAISTTRAIYCWGDGSAGQLGQGSRSSSAVPVAIDGELRFVSVAAGTTHSCGLATNGRLYCWGSNSDGQLGDGTTSDSLVPVVVGSDLQFQQVVVGAHHSCALTHNQAYCWGRNSDGQLGDGTHITRLAPTLVRPLS